MGKLDGSFLKQSNTVGGNAKFDESFMVQKTYTNAVFRDLLD